MAVLVSSRVTGQTREGYHGVLVAVKDIIKDAPGFIMQTAYPDNDGWQVLEVWDSKADADRWFTNYVVPNIPPGIRPKRSYQILYNVLTPLDERISAG